jgi:hypothetical protein
MTNGLRRVASIYPVSQTEPRGSYAVTRNTPAAGPPVDDLVFFPQSPPPPPSFSPWKLR